MNRKLFINAQGKPEVVPNEEDLEVSETGVSYIIRPHGTDKDNEHMVYKVHQIGRKFYWIGLWNSIVLYGEEKGYSSLNRAILMILKENIEVEEVTDLYL